MIETMVVVAQHRNQYYGKAGAHCPSRFDAFGSPPSRGFKDISCRSFQSGAGLLATPLKACSTAGGKRGCSSSLKTPSPSIKTHSEESKHQKRTVKSNAIPIPIYAEAEHSKDGLLNDHFYSELWAGPAYSNSPPPSSLPIPKFSLRPKRTVSLDLPASSASDINFRPLAKSAPPSPTRDHSNSSRYFFESSASATKNLRRILNLDITDE
ncbi:uncharacterized protein LOC127798436 [Diospyros lotus]|uniref:uncharacterized protein LOC127798436 n=1 Tax=Diospyros lotus TaxID=55363 RepID=UPI002253CF6C|nr:uncharacterized protein LOC127798436 [Diospyros lotus]XP_052187959.1 uncharacterized protein LOC127798436 [Diospyros lotus]